MRDAKKFVCSLGADLCGIAEIDRFDGAPKGFHPIDVLPACKSVIVFACEFPREAGVTSDHVVYTYMRDYLTDRMDDIASAVCREFGKHGIVCMPISTCLRQICLP